MWCGDSSAEPDRDARAAAFGRGEDALMTAAENGDEEQVECALTIMKASINALEPKVRDFATYLRVLRSDTHVPLLIYRRGKRR